MMDNANQELHLLNSTPSTPNTPNSPSNPIIKIDFTEQTSQSRQSRKPSVVWTQIKAMSKKRKPNDHLGNHGSSEENQQELHQRIILKNGKINTSSIKQIGLFSNYSGYFSDLLTTMVDMKWRWNLLVFILGFLVSWFVFAMLWWLIAYGHGDITGDLDQTDEMKQTTNISAKHVQCVKNLNSFSSALIFSIETQTTIGYGFVYLNDECPSVILALCLQTLVGMILEILLVGFVIAKLLRPSKRGEFILFSENAVVCKRDGQMTFMFRIADIRPRSQLINASIKAWFVSQKKTQEGELIAHSYRNISVSYEDSSDNNILLFFPATIIHRIDETSPLFEHNSILKPNKWFELIVTLDATIEPTGQPIQVKTSYLPHEILWNHRFEQMIVHCESPFETEIHRQYNLDYAKFNQTYKI